MNVNILFQEILHHRISITVRWASCVWPVWVSYRSWCFYRRYLVNWWSVTRRKSRVLRRLQFYLDFETLVVKRLCYSLQSHNPHCMDSVGLVHLKAEHEYSIEFILFQMNISCKSDLECFYSNWYEGLLLWCTHDTVFSSFSGEEVDWNPIKGGRQRNLIFFSGREAYFEKGVEEYIFISILRIHIDMKNIFNCYR